MDRKGFKIAAICRFEWSVYIGFLSAVIDEGQVEVQRAEQSRRYAHIASGIWVCLSLFLWFRGYRLGALFCTAQTVVMLMLSFAYRNKRGLREHRQFTNVFLGLSCLTIFLVTVSEPDLWVALFFVPLGIVMASQVLGVRAALRWLGVNIIIVLAYPFAPGAFNPSLQTPGIDSLVIAIGVPIGAYLSCVQFEILFRKRTDALVELGSRFQKLATTDPLTGLMNRRKFQDHLAARLKHLACCQSTWTASRKSTTRWGTQSAMKRSARSPTDSAKSRHSNRCFDLVAMSSA